MFTCSITILAIIIFIWLCPNLKTPTILFWWLIYWTYSLKDIHILKYVGLERFFPNMTLLIYKMPVCRFKCYEDFIIYSEVAFNFICQYWMTLAIERLNEGGSNRHPCLISQFVAYLLSTPVSEILLVT